MLPAPADVYVAARRALLDALAALEPQLAALVLVGAQAIYVHAGEIDEAIATETSDGDVAVDPGRLADAPLLEEALADAGFVPNEVSGNPGAWLSPEGVEVDLMIPKALAPGSGTRSVEIPPHSPRATRRVAGLEGALVDNAPHRIAALEPEDPREFEIAVAGPAALLTSKLHKIHERMNAPPRRRKPKDSHDVYRLLRDVDLEETVAGFERILADGISCEPARAGLDHLRMLFGSPDAPGATMAGETVAGVGDVQAVSDGASALALDLLDALEAAR